MGIYDSPIGDKTPQGYNKYAWKVGGHLFGCRGECLCVDVHPDNCIPARSFLVVPLDTGIARAMTADDIKNPQPKCHMYFTTCEIAPTVCRQAWVYGHGTTLNIDELCLDYYRPCTDREIRNFAQANGIVLEKHQRN